MPIREAFCKDFQDYANKKKSPAVVPKYQFDQIVTKFLLFHPGRIEKFKVTIPDFSSMVVPDVNKWILCLSQKNIKEINLRIQGECASCPVLQRILLRGCSGVCNFNISGSKLKKLSIKADDKFESISLENAPNLTEVSVLLEKVKIGRKGNPISDLVSFVNSLPKVKILRLNGKFLQFLTETPVPPMLPTLPNSLKILQVEGVNFTNVDQISAASRVKLKQEQVSGYLKLLDCTTLQTSSGQVNGYLRFRS
ncbi:hypothetical protein HAX54_045833 [Datura stramonium]|uniref:Uncharacterized protein n=1 Tax=Datura stramonium TaxID=4076 RepID=A0ABS8SR08_DATST|nr:hypothetical protein [Datura stramonium]